MAEGEISDNMAADHSYVLMDDYLSCSLEVTVGDLTYSSYLQETEVDLTMLSDLSPSTNHRGPISTDYIPNKRQRQKTYSKRVKTFLKDGDNLHRMCGAAVRLVVTNEAGHSKDLFLPPRTLRTVATQTSTSEDRGHEENHRSNNLRPRTIPGTPKKGGKSAPKIKNLQTKKKDSILKFQQKVSNKCSVCKIIFNRTKDSQYQKREGKKAAKWLGCDKDGCQYWAHAKCAGITIKTLKSAGTIKFMCPSHSQSE